MTSYKRVLSTLKHNPNLKAVGANFGWLVGDKVLRLLVALVVSAWIARYLGPERYGVLAYAFTFVAMFQAISLLGLDNLVVRDLAAGPAQAHRYLGTAFRLRLIGALVAYGLMMTVALVFQHDNKLITVVIALVGLSIFFQISDVIDLWFQSQVQSRRTVLAKAVSYLITAAIKIIMVTSGAGLIAFASASALETALSAIALYFSYQRLRTQNQ